MKSEFYVNKEKYEKLNGLAKETHCNISIIKMFCDYYKNIDDFYKIIPIIDRTNKIADTLYAALLNL